MCYTEAKAGRIRTGRLLDGLSCLLRDQAFQLALLLSWQLAACEQRAVPFREVGDSVVALGWIRGTGRGSGAAINARAGWVVGFRDGLIASFRTYADRSEALRAVGVIE